MRRRRIVAEDSERSFVSLTIAPATREGPTHSPGRRRRTCPSQSPIDRGGLLARSLHDAIHDEEEAIRAAQGLGRNDFTGSLASELDIMEQAMLQAGVPQAKSDELRAQSEAYGARKHCPP